MKIRGSAAWRRPSGAAAMAGLALLVLPASLLPRAHRSRTQTPVPALPAAPAPHGGEAGTLLAAVRGIAPLACELVVRSAGNGWGWGNGDPEDAPAVDRTSDDTRAVLEWLGDRPGTAADAAALQAGLEDTDACVRRLSARLLARDEVPGGHDILLRALASEGPRREAAILGLGYAGDARAVGPLGALLGDADPEIRGGAVWALGHTDRHEAAVDVARLTGDREARVRRAVAHALGRLEDTASIPALTTMLSHDSDPSVRRAAAWALGKMD